MSKTSVYFVLMHIALTLYPFVPLHCLTNQHPLGLLYKCHSKKKKILSCTQEKPHDMTYAQKSKWVLQSIVSQQLSVTVFKAN